MGLGKTIRYAHGAAKKASGKMYRLLLFLSLMEMFQMYVYLASTEEIIDSVTLLFEGETTFFAAVQTILFYGVLTMVCVLLSLGKDKVTLRLHYDLSRYLKGQLNDKLSGMKMEYFETHESMVKIHDVRTRMEEVFRSYVKSIADYVSAVPLLVVYGFYLSRINPYYVLVYGVLFVVFNMLLSRSFRGIHSIWGEAQKYDQKQQYYFNLCGDKNSHQEYKANRLYDYFFRIWEKAFDGAYRKRLQIFRRFEVRLQLSRLVFNVPYIVMLMLVALEVYDGKLSVGFLIMTNSLLNGILDTYGQIQDDILENRTNSRTVENYCDILNYEEYGETREACVKGEIAIRIPEYRYPQSNNVALQDVSLTLKEHEKLMIVGMNGSGKTTFVNLLTSLLSDPSVTIRVNGEERGLGDSVACIFQDFFHYQMSVKENVAMGDRERELSDEEVWSLLEDVGLKERVKKLKHGLDTNLGQLNQEGDFSKGEWQRIAIARLLAKKDAGIWILDEPTAYLDPLSEIELYKMIYRLAGDRTVIFISHRLGFARWTDRILVFENGGIAEQGSHEELMEKEGLYRQMYALQQEWYET